MLRVIGWGSFTEGRVRILLVEDEPFIALDLESMISGLGHHVVGVGETEAESMDLAVRLRPEAALVDIKLKDGFTGVEIARRLNQDFGVTCAFVTGNPEQIEAGCRSAVTVVRKPFTEAEIVAALKVIAGPRA